MDVARHLLEEGRRRAATARARTDLGQEGPQAERLENLLGDLDLLGPISTGCRRERYADRVADALVEQDRQAGRRGDDPLGAEPRLGQAEVERVVAAPGEDPVDVDQVADPGNLRRQDDPLVRKARFLGKLSRTERTLDHRFDHHRAAVAWLGRRGIGVHEVGQQLLVEGAPVDADADGLVVLDRHSNDRLEVRVVML